MISREQLKLWKALAINDPWAIACEAVPALLSEVESQAKEIERLRADLANSVRLGPPRRSEPFVFDPEDTYGGVLMAEKDVAAAKEIERLRERERAARIEAVEEFRERARGECYDEGGESGWLAHTIAKRIAALPALPEEP